MPMTNTFVTSKLNGWLHNPIQRPHDGENIFQYRKKEMVTAMVFGRVMVMDLTEEALRREKTKDLGRPIAHSLRASLVHGHRACQEQNYCKDGYNQFAVLCSREAEAIVEAHGSQIYKTGPGLAGFEVQSCHQLALSPRTQAKPVSDRVWKTSPVIEVLNMGSMCLKDTGTHGKYRQNAMGRCIFFF